MLHIQVDAGDTDASFELLCKKQAGKVFITAEDNLCAPSYYIAKGLLGVNPHTQLQYEEHICSNYCIAFPKLRPSQFEAHQDDRCSVCQARRFHVIESGSKTYPKAVNPFYYYGIAETVRHQCFKNPRWTSARASGRSDTTNGWRHSPDYQRMMACLHEVYDIDLDSADTSTYNLGMDCGQMFKNRNWSCGIVGLRYLLYQKDHPGCSKPIYNGISYVTVLHGIPRCALQCNSKL